MKNTLRKILSVALVAIMVFSLAVPALGTYEEYPTIYVTGAQTNKIYDAEGNYVSDFSFDFAGIIAENNNELLASFAWGMLTDDYSEWAGKFHTIAVDVFGGSALDKNGEATNGTHPEHHSSTVDVEEKFGDYGIWDYRFWYDWRISPLVVAEDLEAYIDRVIAATGKDKVNIVGRCYGANVIAAYVELNKDHAEKYVDDISYYAPSIEGIDFMTALFTGDIYLDDQGVENFGAWFIENKDLIKDDAVAMFVVTLVELLNQAKALGFTAEMLDLLIQRIKTYLIPPILRDTFASWPSYWSMVTEGNLEKAIDFIFADCKDEYAGFIAKVRDYHATVQVNHADTVKEMMNKGVRYNVFAKYNFPEYPIYVGSTIQSDGDTPIPRQTFGATAADYGEVLSEEYIATISEENLKYLSPDFKIDASTGMLPENTWYVKNLHHNHWGSIEDVSLDIMNNDYNVSNQDVYPQFMDDANEMKEVTPDEDYTKPKNNIVASAIRFLTAFFNFLAKLFSGEINFSEVFGSI